MSARGRLGGAGNGVGPRSCASLLLATDVGEAKGGLAVAAAIAVALAVEEPGRASGVLLAELGGERGRGPTMLASAPARELEEGLREAGFERVAARGRLCWLGLPATVEALGELPRVLAAVPAASAGDRPSTRPAVAAGPGGAGPASHGRGCFAPIFQATGRWRRWRWPSFASGASRRGSPRGRSAGLPRAVRMAGLETGGAVGQARGPAGSRAGRAAPARLPRTGARRC